MENAPGNMLEYKQWKVKSVTWDTLSGCNFVSTPTKYFFKVFLRYFCFPPASLVCCPASRLWTQCWQGLASNWGLPPRKWVRGWQGLLSWARGWAWVWVGGWGLFYRDTKLALIPSPLVYLLSLHKDGNIIAPVSWIEFLSSKGDIFIWKVFFFLLPCFYCTISRCAH